MKRIDPYRIVIEQTGRMKQPAKLFVSDTIRIEDKALQQLKNTASLDDDSVVLATPDIHTGFGVPIGCIFASKNLISPCAVGYDINCGMRLLTTPFLPRDIDVQQLANSIRREIPLGEGKKNISVSQSILDMVLESGMRAMPKIAEHDKRVAISFNRKDHERDSRSTEDHGSLEGNPSCVSKKAHERGFCQLATLGGGNHFIEIQLVESIYDASLAQVFGIKAGYVTIMIHSGSRGLGHQVAGEYMSQALKWNLNNNMFLPDRELAYFHHESDMGKRYLGAMNAAANFAFVNRMLMAQLVRKCTSELYGPGIHLPSVYDVPHNIAKFESHGSSRYCVHRKGATRAFSPERMADPLYSKTGQPVLIPGSMGTASYFLSGVPSGKESLFSVNHGAGRLMSRSKAAGRYRKGKKIREAAISDHEFTDSMKGVYLVCEDRRSIKEEAPGAYKDIDEVIAVVTGAGLAKAVARMRPLAVLKG
jgi:tRNA-splicing ligase RtcB